MREAVDELGGGGAREAADGA
eukprot:SAG31_NODE_21181_length_556_cov_0.568928_1_plen_20_part_01